MRYSLLKLRSWEAVVKGDTRTTAITTSCPVSRFFLLQKRGDLETRT
jgi:predicted methyltransferase